MQPTSKLLSKPTPVPESDSRQNNRSSELPKRPRKPNSEARKKQNRIASRNYREKRKQKLHYLQQLFDEQSENESTASTSTTTPQVSTHTPSPEIGTQSFVPECMENKPNDYFYAHPPDNNDMIDPALTVGTAASNNFQPLPTHQLLPEYDGTPWNCYSYDSSSSLLPHPAPLTYPSSDMSALAWTSTPESIDSLTRVNFCQGQQQQLYYPYYEQPSVQQPFGTLHIRPPDRMPHSGFFHG